MQDLVLRIPPRLKSHIKSLAGLLPLELCLGALYRRKKEFLSSAQWWSLERIQDWQLRSFRELVRHAMENTEGYRELYKNAGVRADDIRSLNDIRHLPFTSKEMFRDHLESFSVSRRSRRYITTGGSTGIPFGFYEDPSTLSVERAFIHAAWEWMGWKPGMHSAVLRGGFVGSEKDFSCWDAYLRELNLSSYYLGPGTLDRYLNKLFETKITTIQSYPSSLNLLCDLLKESGNSDKLRVELFLLGSENIYDWQLSKFQEVFPTAKFHSWYGHCEKAILAPWCEKSRNNHQWPYYGLLEVLDDRDNPVGIGIEGELVGTSFVQKITPFIRYRTYDRGVNGGIGCQSCGRQFQTITKIMGRSHEVIVSKTGRFISMTAMNMHDEIFDGLRQFQFVQLLPGVVNFHYVPKALSAGPSDLDRIYKGLKRKLGDDVELELHQVESIPKTKMGKFRFLDQRLSIRYGDRQ